MVDKRAAYLQALASPRFKNGDRVTKLLGIPTFVSLALLASGCRTEPPGHTAVPTASRARPAVIPAGGGEERVLRGGAASLFIKVDPISTGSETLMVGYSDLSPGDAIGVHRHLQEDEVMVITRGTGRVQLGSEFHTATVGATVFIPRGTCIGLTNVGPDTLSNFFVFSAPGFEKALRRVSTAPGEPVKPLTPQLRAEAFHEGHAVANPPDC